MILDDEASGGADTPLSTASAESAAPTASSGPDGSDGVEPVAERAREGLEHLQAAARELIAAARAALDVAEDIVDDPSIVKHLTESRAGGAPRASGTSSPSGSPGTASWLEGMATLAGAFAPLGDLVRGAAAARSFAAGRDRTGQGDDAAGPSGSAEPTVERIIIR